MLKINIRKGFKPHIVYIIALPLFFLVFCLAYNPFDILGFYECTPLSSLGDIAILSSIILVTVTISRLLFWLVRSKKDLLWWQCIGWGILEVGVVAAFMALYTCLNGNQDYLYSLSLCVKYAFLILIYPYLIIAAIDILLYSVVSSNAQAEDDPASLVKFYDEHNKLKLVISDAAILFIKAEDNYIKIHYLEGGNVKTYELRNSMRSIEEVAPRHGIYRCQRSYYVNPRHVKVLRKDKEGFIFAELDLPDLAAIPVSKRYYQAISDRL